MFRQWLFWPVFAAIMGFVVGGSLVWGLQQPVPNNQHQPAKAESQNRPSADMTASPGGNEQSEKRNKEGHWYNSIAEHATDWLLVLFNGILAAFTVRLFYATSGLVKAAAADQRAWIVTGLEIGEGGITFENETIVIDVNLRITNVGRTVALGAHTNIEVIGDVFGSPEKVRTFATENRVRGGHNGRPVSPSETYFRPWFATAKNTDIGHATIITCCVTYEILQDSEIHQTAFAYLVGRKEKGMPWGAAIYSAGRNLRADEIVVSTFSGGFAD